MLTGAGAGDPTAVGMQMLEDVWRMDRNTLVVDEEGKGGFKWERVKGGLGSKGAPVGRYASQVSFRSCFESVFW